MKTHSIIFSALFFIIAYSANAQTATDATKKTGNEWHAAGNAIPRSQAFAQRLDSALQLGPDLKKKVFQAYLANTKPVDEIKFSRKSDKEKQTLLEANKLNFNGTMKAILPPDKYVSFEKLKIDR